MTLIFHARVMISLVAVARELWNVVILFGGTEESRRMLERDRTSVIIIRNLQVSSVSEVTPVFGQIYINADHGNRQGYTDTFLQSHSPISYRKLLISSNVQAEEKRRERESVCACVFNRCCTCGSCSRRIHKHQLRRNLARPGLLRGCDERFSRGEPRAL